MKVEEYEDIPGTTVFDAQRARRGYHINQFLYSLMSADNRKEFLADEHKYLLKYPMSEDARQAVMKRAWNKLLELGAVSYALAKLAFTDGHSYQYMAAEMTGMTQQEYADMMIHGGRSVEGWRSKRARGEA
jgi:protocatechuate 4,5-dioxygenase alpha chain